MRQRTDNMSTPMYVWEALKSASFYQSHDVDPFTGYESTPVCNYCGNGVNNKHKRDCPVGHVEEHIGHNNNKLATIVLLNGDEKTINKSNDVKGSTIFEITWHRSPTMQEYQDIFANLYISAEQKYDFGNHGCLHK